MNNIKIEKVGAFGRTYNLGGGDVYINGNRVKGVLDLKPNLTDANEIASVTLTVAVSAFEYAFTESTVTMTTGPGVAECALIQN